MRILFAALFLLVVGGCAPTADPEGGDILVIGDSVMAWNRTGGEDVGAVVGRELNRSVINRAGLGAQIRAGGPAALFGLSIPDQIPPGTWNWVIMNGAANDLGISCDCIRCDAEIEALIAADGAQGDIPDLVERAQRQGAQVVWVGYYKAPETRAFQGCRPGLVEVERRIAEFARETDGFYFLDAENVFDPDDRSLFDLDRTHPSPAGSAVIGRYIAETISEN